MIGNDNVVLYPLNYCRILAAGGQLAKTVDQQLVDDLGFSKRYTRCLQVLIIHFALV